MSTSAIGIDLGTTNCCVAVWQGDGVEIISNDVGGRVTPSYVSFDRRDDDERLIGAPAKAQAHGNEKNTVFAVKRLMGRPFSDTAVQSDITRWPFQVCEGPGDVPTIRVQYRGEQKDLAPQEISAMLLSAAKADAEDFLDDEVTQAVITVPAYFNDAQRAATKAAGEIAGLEVLRILNEPTAGALAYGVDKSRSVKSKVLIYDLGGGTCDVSIQEIEAEDFHVLAVRGDTHLGGEDIDNALVEHFLQEIKQECGMNLGSDTRARRRLQTAAEVAKITLSGSDTAYVEVDGLLHGRDFQTRVTRARFERLCEDLFRRCITPVEQCLEDAGLEAEDLDEVVLVGGSTRIPKVQTLLQRLLNGKALNKSVNPDEAVAYGAAIQAAMLTDTYDPKLQRLSLQDVTALPLGVRVFPFFVDVVVPKNTPTPVRKTCDDYTNLSRNCSSITFSVHEGEERIATPASRIGKFTVHDLPTGPRGSQKYSATFEINEDGMLTVTGMHTVTGQSGNVTIDYGSRRIDAAELQGMKDEAAKFRRDDEAVKSSRRARHTLAGYAHGMQRALEAGLRDVLSGPEEDTLAEAARAAEQWLGSLSGRKEAHVYEAMQHGLEEAAEAVLREATQRHAASMQLPRSVMLAAGEEFSKTLLSIMMEAM